jgi:lipopolysaccharide/colanic/teichoic acid biosynthesis glycosyltransferase
MGLNGRRSTTGEVYRASVGERLQDKRLFDISAALLILLFTWPLMVALAVALLLLQGRPVIYRQSRVGLNGRAFLCLKFRTMVRDADLVLEKHLQTNTSAAAEWLEKQKLTVDPRITALGNFLRRSSLDELPQLLNVLRGEMSIVGPRPILAEELVRYGSYANQLISVRPGLTGLWQVSGRSDLPYETRIKLDVKYIQSRSLGTDMMIIVKTVPVILMRRGSV